MSSMSNKIVRQYLKEVSAKLNCSRSMKSVFVKELKSEISQFVGGHGDVTLDDICEKFGTPEEVVNGFYDRSDYEKLLRKAKRKVILWRIIAAVLLVAIVVLFIYVTHFITELGGHFYVTNADTL